MKAIKLMKGFFATAMAVVLLSATSAAPLLVDSKAYDPSGDWTYEVAMPDGTLTGDMKIAKADGEYEVTIESNVYGTLELEDVNMEDMTMEANIEIEGDIIDFEFEFDGDSMEGTIYTPDGEIDMTAERSSK